MELAAVVGLYHEHYIRHLDVFRKLRMGEGPEREGGGGGLGQLYRAPQCVGRTVQRPSAIVNVRFVWTSCQAHEENNMNTVGRHFVQ